MVNDNDPLNISGGSTADSIYVDGNYASMVFDVQDTYYSPDNSGLTISGMTTKTVKGPTVPRVVSTRRGEPSSHWPTPL